MAKSLQEEEPVPKAKENQVLGQELHKLVYFLNVWGGLVTFQTVVTKKQNVNLGFLILLLL